MTLIAGIWAREYSIIASDTRETIKKDGIDMPPNDEFEKIIVYRSIAIGFAGHSKYEQIDDVVGFVKSIFDNYQYDLNFTAFFDDLNNATEDRYKPNTDIYLIGFKQNIPVAIEYKIFGNKLINHSENKNCGIIFNHDPEKILHLKDRISKYAIEVFGNPDPDFNEIPLEKAILFLEKLFMDQINDKELVMIGGKFIHYIFRPES